MYIPLDYYRILGLPIQATSDQLRQAHRDRTLQLPRREYSDAAIASRKQILDEASAVLSDPERRRSYDASFLAKTYELDPNPEPSMSIGTAVRTISGDSGSDSHTPSIEIRDDQLVGALLILQELGEYELVLKLGRPFLTGGSASLRDGRYGKPNIVYADIVLTVALACLELGREQWQQSQYENAAEALDTGQSLLLREGLFASVRGEIQADLYKLRPYRLLELLAFPETQVAQRHRGLQLLQEMLEERGGIDGSGDDQSGLNVDDFLRFVQQLRSYMTAAEQQVIFEEEARRPSAVGVYLTVYALLARGFAEHQPGLIRRANRMLQPLSDRQDVHLEQAVCTLLLGQPEDASRELEQSQEYESLAFIREHSQGAPDLLPGLCLYAERWLQDEVFPHFCDLANRKVSLKDYFADPQVQEYLEEMPNEPELNQDWSVTAPRATPVAASPSPFASAATLSKTAKPSTATSSATYGRVGRTENEEPLSEEALIELARARLAAGNAATFAGTGKSANTATMPAAERIGQGDPPLDNAPRTGDRRQRGEWSPNRDKGNEGSGSSPMLGDITDGRLRQRSSGAKESGISRFLLPIVLLLLLIGFGFAATWLWRTFKPAPADSVAKQPTTSAPASPAVPAPSPKASASKAVMNEATAQQTIEAWLAAKASAMGPDHVTDKLATILVDPKLAEWQSAAKEANRDGWYKQYEHKVKVTSVELDKSNPNQAKALADVDEVTKYYVGSKLKDTIPDTLQVRYSLVRQDGKWYIKTWEVLK